jgi:signal transduction histidine kinase
MTTKLLQLTAQAGKNRPNGLKGQEPLAEAKQYPLSDREFAERFRHLMLSAEHELNNLLFIHTTIFDRAEGTNLESDAAECGRATRKAFQRLKGLRDISIGRGLEDGGKRSFLGWPFFEGELKMLGVEARGQSHIDYSELRRMLREEAGKMRDGIAKTLELAENILGGGPNGSEPDVAIRLKRIGYLLCGELEALAKGDMGTIEGEPLNISSIARAIKTSSGCSVAFGEDLESMRISASLSSLVIIVYNIKNNAERSAREAKRKPDLEIYLQRTEGGIRAVFSDNGGGMSEEAKDKLNNGVRTTTKPAEEPGEHGIGYLTCREFARLMGGNLYVESTGPQGTVNVLELRAAEQGKAD